MSDDTLSRPLIDPTAQRRRRLLIAVAVVAAFILAAVLHLVA
jgi:hypothetical protein